MNAKVGLTMSSDITESLFAQVSPFQEDLHLGPRAKIPVIQSLDALCQGEFEIDPRAYACLLREERVVLLWNETVEGILAHGADVEDKLMAHVWGSHISTPYTPYSYGSYARQSSQGIESSGTSISGKVLDEKHLAIQAAIELEERGDDHFDPNTESAAPPPRPFLLLHASVIGVSVALVVFVEMLCISKLLTEYRYDGQMLRMALLATIPVFTMFSLFFFVVISGSLFQLFGPLTWVRSNSQFYSAKPPKPERYPDYELPHITIQMPVYKEGLKGVIIPTVTSLQAAIKKYEQRGGTASIFINDDGMQTVSAELAEARRAFYEVNGIGWCSRPKDTSMITVEREGASKWSLFGKNKKVPNPEGFHRKGQFKKASNMNYCMDFSLRVEDEFLRLMGLKTTERQCTTEDLTIEDENELYEEAMKTIIEGDEGRTLAAGNVRIGEVILLIDSDTRVPEDCLVYGALELHESPEVAILQHASGVMQVAHNAFENGITYFTNLIYMSIQFAVGNGDSAPFVGHNAFLRWKAVQAVSFEEDGMRKFWSDSHVSEDFDISLRMQMNKFIVRLATYHYGGFKEGVSLTVYDELARWEKYAYGCNELVFRPFKYWYKGPFTPLFTRFLWSDIKITSKMTILAYIGTYYAIAAAIPLTLANYCIIGWFQDNVDQFYLTSWKIFVGMAVVFNILSPLAFAMLRHRLGEKIFFWSVVETIKWTPMFVLFFGGLSLHLSAALLCHFFSIKMEWTATAKEVENQGFRVGLDKIVRDFKFMYCFCIPVIAGMIYLGTSAPRGWQIKDFAVIVPLANQIGCHALLPFALGLV
ncbi:glycosyl transferase family group 2-domain-containing protein [Tricladium varicosporioides]|nr:glycosyl transferase family group 2-domain-containing protein [Hymenoscyphus varicosporioides]